MWVSFRDGRIVLIPSVREDNAYDIDWRTRTEDLSACVCFCTFCVFWCGIIWVHSNLGAEVKSILCHPFSKTFQCNIIRFETRYFWRYFWICRIRRSFQGGWHLVGQQKILMEKPNIKCMILYCKINNNIRYLIQFQFYIIFKKNFKFKFQHVHLLRNYIVYSGDKEIYFECIYYVADDVWVKTFIYFIGKIPLKHKNVYV